MLKQKFIKRGSVVYVLTEMKQLIVSEKLAPKGIQEHAWLGMKVIDRA